MDNLMKSVLDWVLAHAAEMLLALLTGLVSYGLVQLRKVPASLHEVAEKMAEEAKKTPGAADDVAAKLLLVFSDVLKAVLERNFGTPKTK